jgi:hypothetical protein
MASALSNRDQCSMGQCGDLDKKAEIMHPLVKRDAVEKVECVYDALCSEMGSDRAGEMESAVDLVGKSEGRCKTRRLGQGNLAGGAGEAYLADGDGEAGLMQGGRSEGRQERTVPVVDASTVLVPLAHGAQQRSSSGALSGEESLVTPKVREEKPHLLGHAASQSDDEVRGGEKNGAAASEEHEDEGDAPRKSVLVTKCLTNSDASSGRIILPRVAVETNLPFVTGCRHYTLNVKDLNGKRYDFVVKSWANGTEHRRVFVLEQVGKFLKAYGVGVGDTVGICSTGDGELTVEVNTQEVLKQASSGGPKGKSAAVHQQDCMPGVLHRRHAGKALAVQQQPQQGNAGMRCVRNVHCSKLAGHPGFCSGPKSGAARASSGTSWGGRTMNKRQIMLSEDSQLTASEAYNYSSGMVAAAMEEYSSDYTAYPVSPREGLLEDEMKQLPKGLNTLALVPSGVKISKRLTAYDLSSRRIVLPAEETSQSLCNVSANGDVYTIALVDESDAWHFMTLRSWYSVTGRRGFYIEDAEDFMKARRATVGDDLVVSRDSPNEPPRISIVSGSHGMRRPKEGVTDGAMRFADLPVMLLPFETFGKDRRRASKRMPWREHGCNRTSGCTKEFGHQGFCSGHRGFKRKECEMPMSRVGRHSLREYDFSLDDDDEYTPMHRGAKHARYSDIDRGICTPRGSDDPLVSLLNLLQ